MPLDAGSRLGPYEILAPLGAGGMGEVYRARDTRLGRDVAVKVLPPEFAADPDRVTRFAREARATAVLNHPNILTVYDTGTHDGQPYLVEELLEGESLRQRLGAGPLSPRAATDIGIQVARGLAAAHERQIVHRDLKPDNVFLTTGGGVKVLDFGLAKLLAPSAAPDHDAMTQSTGSHTAPGHVVGTVAYMAPEQARGYGVDLHADIFSLGVLLYEMLAGRRPFRGQTFTDTLAAILTEDPEPLPGHVPPALSSLVRRCLQKRPEDRFGSARDLALALEVISPSPDATSAPQPGSASKTRVAVAVFENRTGEPSLDLLGLMAADWITDGLTQIPSVDVGLPPSSAIGLGAAGDPSGRAAYADPRRVAEVTGATLVISGTYHLADDQIVFRTRLSEPGRGRVIAALEPTGGARERPSDLVQQVSELAVGAVAQHLDTRYDLRAERPPSLDVYAEVARANDCWFLDWDVVIHHLERAVALDSRYVRARIQLACARFFSGHYVDAQRELDAVGDTGRLTEYERQGLLAMRAHLSGQTWGYLAAAREQARLAPGAAQGPFDAAVMAYYVNRPMEAESYLADIGEATYLAWSAPEIRAHVLHLAARYGDQLDLARRAGARYPTMLYFHEHEAAALAALGRLDELEQTVNRALTAQASSGTPGLVMLVAAMELRAHGRRGEADAMATRAAHWYGAQSLDRFVALQAPNRGVEWYRSRPPDIKKRLREEHAMALGLAGRWNEVQSLVIQLAHEDPASIDYMGWLGVLAARRGDHAEARTVAEQLLTLDRPYVFGSGTYWRACVAAQLGEKQQAVDLLTQAFSEGYWFQTQLHRTIDLEPLWDFAPFRGLLRPKG